MEDALGKALLDYYYGNHRYKLWIHNRYGRKEEMPIGTYFRNYDEISELELLALEACTGHVLDIGAGAGSNALILQQRNYSVDALDISLGAAQVMHERGVKKIINKNIAAYGAKRYNTLLLMMNGVGIAATINGLKALLHHFKSLLLTAGQVVFDSSDVAYLYTNQQLPAHYYGEIEYRYQYKRWFTAWFNWLYIDRQTMSEVAAQSGFTFEVIGEDDFGQYLGKLKIL